MKHRPTPMDSGFSWVVLAGSFLCLFCFSVLASSAGILQVEIMEDLQVGSGIVSTMTAFAVGMSTMLGPLSGVLSNLMSLRYTVFIGIILMCVGMLLASFCSTIQGMMFCYGIMTGVGYGIAYCPCVVIISMYFDKRHLMANGIIFCAPGLGVLSMPYLVRHIIDNYGWRYCMAINAGILLHILVFASFFVPTEVERRRMVKPSCCCWRTGDASLNGSDVSDEDDLDTQSEKNEIPQDTVVSNVKEDLCSSTLSHPKLGMLLMNGSFGDTHSLGSGRNLSLSPHSGIKKPYIPVYINGTPETKSFPRSPITDFLASESFTGYSLSVEDVHLEAGWSKTHRDNSLSQFSSQSFITSVTDTNHLTVGHPSPFQVKSHHFGQLRKQRSLLGSSLGFASSEFGSSLVLPIKIEALPSPEVEDVSLKATLRRVSKNKAMWVMCLHCFFFMCGCGMHSVHFPAYVASKGLSPHYVSLFYTVYGIGLLSGRLCGAMIYNRIKPPMLPLLFILEILNGLVLGLSPFFASNPLGIFFLEGLLSLVYGQSYMLQAPLASELVLVEDMPIAFGITQLFNGIGFVISPILAGFIYDMNKTYDIPMHLAGSFVIIGAFILLAMLLVKRDTYSGIPDMKQARKEKEQEERRKLNSMQDDMEEVNVDVTSEKHEKQKETELKPRKEEEEIEVKPTKVIIREVGKV